MKNFYVARKARMLMIGLCVFAPFLVVAYAVFAIPDMHAIRNFGGLDWMWLILLAFMMLGLYYFLAIYVREKADTTAAFERLDRDRDGFISLQDAGNWSDLRRLFSTFDSDHDGRMSRVEFESFQNSLYSH